MSILCQWTHVMIQIFKLCVFDLLVSAALLWHCVIIIDLNSSVVNCLMFNDIRQSVQFPCRISRANYKLLCCCVFSNPVCIFLCCSPVTPTAETHKPEEDTFGVSDWSMLSVWFTFWYGFLPLAPNHPSRETKPIITVLLETYLKQLLTNIVI